jgi:type 1 glutamine amidotransferase
MKLVNDKTERRLSRRELIGHAVAAASALPLASALGRGVDAAQNPPPAPAQAGAPGGAPAGAQPQAPRPGPQGGTGPLNVLLITKGHSFDRENLFLMFDSFGKEIRWAHIEHPADEPLWEPAAARAFDAFVFFDRAGRQEVIKPDGSRGWQILEPSPTLKKNTQALLQAGKGMVFLHHSIASWVQNWPEYVEVMGAAADWDFPMKNIRGKDYPKSGYQPNTPQHITVVDKTHPIVQGIGDGFDITDEVYLCPVFEDSVHPLLRTDFKPIDSNFTLPNQYPSGWRHPAGSNLAGWVKVAERSPIAYLLPGHSRVGWENPVFRTLVLNAIKWAASPEALAWARANPKKIFA